MALSVSIVLPLWNRTALLKKTLVSIFCQKDLPKLEIIVVEDCPPDDSGKQLCEFFGEKIVYCRRYRDIKRYSNVGAVYNIGIRQATGDILIMQSAECKYETPTGIADLVAAIEGDELASAVPLVQSVDHAGRFIEWYCHPREGGRPGWAGMFAHAIHREQVLKVGGYDEAFQGYGFDDDLLLYRLKKNGVKPRHVESVLVTHQWHPRYCGTDERENKKIYLAKIEAVESGREPNVAKPGL